MSANVSQIGEFDDIIDVRTPAEFAADRIPGAVNLPALYDAQRRIIGALYRESAFEAKKQGAALVAENIASHLQNTLANRGDKWRPLIYCWRGGQRSGAVVEVLRRIGWPAEQLEGGYKSYRRWVMQIIADCAPQLSLIALRGRTGVGKTLLLNAINNSGGQILDLEFLAAHRGSVFGFNHNNSQPTQRRFETTLAAELIQFNLESPVFVESESRKIGDIHLPSPLLVNMRSSPSVEVRAEMEMRVAHILKEYKRFADDSEVFEKTIGRLMPFAGRRRIAEWQLMHQRGQAAALTRDLLESFYDVGYGKSLARNYSHGGGGEEVVEVNPNDAESIRIAAEKIIGESETDELIGKARRALYPTAHKLNE